MTSRGMYPSVPTHCTMADPKKPSPTSQSLTDSSTLSEVSPSGRIWPAGQLPLHFRTNGAGAQVTSLVSLHNHISLIVVHIRMSVLQVEVIQYLLHRMA